MVPVLVELTVQRGDGRQSKRDLRTGSMIGGLHQMGRQGKSLWRTLGVLELRPE